MTRKICEPLEEDSFRPILHHYDGPKFRLELNIPEVTIIFLKTNFFFKIIIDREFMVSMYRSIDLCFNMKKLYCLVLQAISLLDIFAEKNILNSLLN